MKIYFLVSQIIVLIWDLAFYIIINKSLNYMVVNFYNLSSLYWLDLKFLYALFEQWSILATDKTKFLLPPLLVKLIGVNKGRHVILKYFIVSSDKVIIVLELYRRKWQGGNIYWSKLQENTDYLTSKIESFRST